MIGAFAFECCHVVITCPSMWSTVKGCTEMYAVPYDGVVVSSGYGLSNFEEDAFFKCVHGKFDAFCAFCVAWEVGVSSRASCVTMMCGV